jgi:hypothetical protein
MFDLNSLDWYSKYMGGVERPRRSDDDDDDDMDF